MQSDNLCEGLRKYLTLLVIMILLLSELQVYAGVQSGTAVIAVGTVRGTESDASVRSEAKSSSSAITSLPAGTILHITDFVSDEEGDKYVWARINLNDGNQGTCVKMT